MSLARASTWLLKQNYHQTFAIINGASTKRHTLLVNPEDMSQSEPARVNVMQTLGGAYVDDFGAGLTQVTISGTTGYKAQFNTDFEYLDGYHEFVNFRKDIYRDFITTNDPKMTMTWYNWEDEEYYNIQPLSFRLQRNARQPLLYRYEFQFICLGVPGAGGAAGGSFLMSFMNMALAGKGGLAGVGNSLLKTGLSSAVGSMIGKVGGMGSMLGVNVGSVLASSAGGTGSLSGALSNVGTAVSGSTGGAGNTAAMLVGASLLSGTSSLGSTVAMGAVLGSVLAKAQAKPATADPSASSAVS